MFFVVFFGHVFLNLCLGLKNEKCFSFSAAACWRDRVLNPYLLQKTKKGVAGLEELCQASLLEKRSIRVSSSVAQVGLSDTITEESVSSDLPGQTSLGLAGWAIIKRRLPTIKEQRHKPTTSQSSHIFLHLPTVTVTSSARCSSSPSPLLLCVFFIQLA